MDFSNSEVIWDDDNKKIVTVQQKPLTKDEIAEVKAVHSVYTELHANPRDSRNILDCALRYSTKLTGKDSKIMELFTCSVIQPESEDIKSDLVSFIGSQEIPECDSRAELVYLLLHKNFNEFRGKFSEYHGTTVLCDHLVSVFEYPYIQQWKAELKSIADNSSQEFDREFASFILSPDIMLEDGPTTIVARILFNKDTCNPVELRTIASHVECTTLEHSIMASKLDSFLGFAMQESTILPFICFDLLEVITPTNETVHIYKEIAGSAFIEWIANTNELRFEFSDFYMRSDSYVPLMGSIETSLETPEEFEETFKSASHAKRRELIKRAVASIDMFMDRGSLLISMLELSLEEPMMKEEQPIIESAVINYIMKNGDLPEYKHY